MKNQKVRAGSMAHLRHEITDVLSHNKDGSFRTQASRKQSLNMFVKAVRDRFKIPSIKSLKQKHIFHFVESMKEDGLSVGTMKNHMSHVRWLCGKIGKVSIVPRTNEQLGIDARCYVNNIDFSWNDKELKEVLRDIDDPFVKLQIRLQDAFGLRMKEAAIFRPHECIRENDILVDYGTKGGQPRVVPIKTDDQRILLNEIKNAVKPGYSLTPSQFSLKQWLNHYYRKVRAAGVQKTLGLKSHGLRHGYAQRRYVELTGFMPTVAYGSASKFYEAVQKDTGMERDQIRKADEQARMVISEELGHHRLDITSQYLGGR